MFENSQVYNYYNDKPCNLFDYLWNMGTKIPSPMSKINPSDSKANIFKEYYSIFLRFIEIKPNKLMEIFSVWNKI